jgi:hypothetical protein
LKVLPVAAPIIGVSRKFECRALKFNEHVVLIESPADDVRTQLADPGLKSEDNPVHFSGIIRLRVVFDNRMDTARWSCAFSPAVTAARNNFTYHVYLTESVSQIVGNQNEFHVFQNECHVLLFLLGSYLLFAQNIYEA